MEWKEIYAKLKEPFPLDDHWWKPGATSSDRCLALPYVDPRAYIERLNDTGVEWSDDYETLILEMQRVFIACRLTINGQTRTDVGEEFLTAGRSGENNYTTASAQAFKRACVKFGLGGYLYSLPQEWVDYDSQRKKITPKGITHLQGALAYHLGQSDDKPITQPTTQTSTQPSTQPSPQAQSARERAKAPAKAQGKPTRPAKPEVVKGWMEKRSKEGPSGTASDKQAELVARLGQEVWAGDGDAEQKYHSCLVYLFDVDSATKLTKGQASAMISYLKKSEDSWDIHPDADKEMNFILAEAMRDAGQQEFPFEGEWEDPTE